MLSDLSSNTSFKIKLKISFCSSPNCTLLIISFAIPWQLSRSLQLSLTQTHLIAAHKLNICFEIFVQFLPARYKYDDSSHILPHFSHIYPLWAAKSGDLLLLHVHIMSAHLHEYYCSGAILAIGRSGRETTL